MYLDRIKTQSKFKFGFELIFLHKRPTRKKMFKSDYL